MDRLPTRERTALDRLASQSALRLAAVSLWEAQMLYAKRRLVLDRPFDRWVREAAAAGVVDIVPLDVEVVVALNGLPASFHGDPADRLIVATARALGAVLLTRDRKMLAYGRRGHVRTITA